MFSCAFDVHLPAAQLPALSPLAGLAACEALRAVAGPGADGLCMKWPNDVQWHDAKLAGVLVETTRNPGSRETGYTVVIGMGVNLVDADALSQALGRQVADWTCVTGHAPATPPPPPTWSAPRQRPGMKPSAPSNATASTPSRGASTRSTRSPAARSTCSTRAT